MKLMERMKVCVSTKLLLLLCFCFIISSGVKVCDHSAPEGSSYTLPLKKGSFTTDYDLQWKHDDTVLVNRKKGRFSRGSAKDINTSGSLILNDLKKTTSAGIYKAEVYNPDGQIVKDLETTWNLCVTDKIPKPSVSFACVKKTLTLTCNVSQPKDLLFKWSENGKDVAKETQRTLTRPVDKLDTGPSYTCTVSKSAVSETSLPLKPSCPKEPESIFPKDLFGFEFWTMVGILASGGALLLTLIIITICCCSRARGRKRKMLIEEQELRLAWSDPQQQQQYQQQHQQQPHQHQQQHQHNHQQPAGHTGPRQQRSKPAQERERTREVDPDAPKLPKPRGTVDPSAPKLPKLRGGDPSAPKLPKTRGGDPSAPKLPDPQGQGGDLSAPKLPNARASPRLPTAEVRDPCSIDEGAPLGPRPGDAAGEEQPPPLPQPRKKVPRAQRGGPDPYAGLR